MLSPRQVCAALSSVWVAVLAATLESVQRSMETGDRGRPARLAVIGMGRLGGAELGYGSDADVLFVCEPVEGADERDAVRYASQVAETVRRRLGSASPDPALVVDADLRPEGRNGPLVRTMESYRAYYARWSQAWEAQALLRASPVAGDAALGVRFVEMVDPVRYPREGLDQASTSPRSGASRRGSTRNGCPAGPTRPPTRSSAAAGSPTSSGRSSCCSCSTRATCRSCAPRPRSTACGEAGEAGLLAPRTVSSWRAAWTMATQARNALMLVRGKPGDQLPRSGRELAGRRLRAGLPGRRRPRGVPRRVPPHARRARTIVERVFYGW